MAHRRIRHILVLTAAMAVGACNCDASPTPGDAAVDAVVDAGPQGCELTPCTGAGFVCGDENVCECGPGYVFDEVLSTCELVSCAPLTLANGTVTPAGDRVFGDVVALGCNTDFALEGNATRTCQSNGTWRGDDATCVATGGTCFPHPCNAGVCSPSGNTYTCDCTGTSFTGPNCDVPVMCSGLVSPLNGSVTPTSAMPDGVATYTCDNGYALVGPAAATCLADGTWSAQPPTCEAVACPTLSAPANGGLTATTGTYNQTTTYSCDQGFAIDGASVRTCQADGTWSGAEPTCVVANDCSANPCQNGSACTDAVPGPGYACACTAGFMGPNCDVPVSCGALAAPSNGQVSATSTTNGGVATYACSIGYERNGNGGSAMRTCQPDGSWSGSAPTCDPLSCSATAPANGSIDDPMPSVGAEVVYSCNTGYTRNGVLARVCQADQTLAGVAPTCDPVVCDATAPTNGSVSATSVTYTGTVSYACDSGYMLGAGDATRTCQADGSFDGSAPTCVPVIGGCTANPCANGTCTDQGAGYLCDCDDGWSGPNCDMPVDCGALVAPSNGTVQTTATTLGNVASYVCNPGYAATGATTRTCEATGAWSGAAPTCDPILCTGLVPPTNGSLDAMSALYPSSVTYACDAGYELVGNGGLATRACQADYTFSGTAPTCQPIDCGALAAPANGTVSGNTTYGQTSTYACNGGYMLVGAATTTCTADGSWSATAPTCELILTPCMPNPCNGGTCTPGAGSNYTCSNCPVGYGGTNCDVPAMCTGASAPTNGAVSATSTTYGMAITYTCDQGYDLVGVNMRTCQANGTFSGSAPTCAPVTCTGLVAPANGTVSSTSATFGNMVGYTCNSGYVLNGSATRTCQAAGTWSGTAPSCDPVDCGTLSAPSNGSVSVPTTTFGSTATYACDNGYALSGAATRSCQANTTWSGSAPSCTLIMTGCTPNPCQNGGVCSPMGGSSFTCDCSGATGWSGSTCSTPVTCGGATAPPNGSVSSSSATYNTTVTYACDSGYALVGAATRLCQANGAFAGTAPTCAAVTCGGATAPANGTVSAASTTYPSSITYGCNAGYTLTGNGGSATRACQANMSFSGTAPTCAPVTCAGAVAPTNGTVSSPSATFASTITYTCNAGYTLTGSATASCQANATFSTPAPTCVPVSCPSLSAPANGSVTVPSTTFGSVAMYSCDMGYALTGSATTSCQANTTWSNPAPTCTAIPMPCSPNPCQNGGTCTPGAGAMYTCACAPGYSGTNCGTPAMCSGATAPMNGGVSAMSATYPNSITYSCNAGYNVVGTPTRACQANGTFSGTAPTCAPVTCGGATAPSNGTVSAPSVTYPNTITYGCNSGYTLSGSGTRTCTAAGTFSGSAPTCVPVDCGTPTIANGTVSAPITTFGGSAAYSCNANYTLQGTTPGTCQANGTWSTPPTCVYNCGTLTTPMNGAVSTTPNTLLGATATYTCNMGYMLMGAATRMCTGSGWSGSAPTCVTPDPIYCDVVYRTSTAPTEHGTLHIYQSELPLGAVINVTTAIGINDLLPSYGNTPNFTSMMTPFTPAAYPSGWIRMRYNANAAGNAPVAGPASLIEFFAPVDAPNFNVTANIVGAQRGVRVNVAIDGSAGLLQTTTVGCPVGVTRCPVLNAGVPVIQRSCQPVATGTLSGSSITWPSCAIADPGGTTGTPNAAQLNWTPEMSVAQPLPNDSSCVRNMVAWGGVQCTAVINNIFGQISCDLAGGLTNAPTNSVWDQRLPTVTLSNTNYASATATIPEFIIPEGGTTTYVGARIANMPVVHVECGTLAQLTCNEQ